MKRFLITLILPFLLITNIYAISGYFTLRGDRINNINNSNTLGVYIVYETEAEGIAFFNRLDPKILGNKTYKDEGIKVIPECEGLAPDLYRQLKPGNFVIKFIFTNSRQQMILSGYATYE